MCWWLCINVSKTLPHILKRGWQQEGGKTWEKEEEGDSGRDAQLPLLVILVSMAGQRELDKVHLPWKCSIGLCLLDVICRSMEDEEACPSPLRANTWLHHELALCWAL